MKHMKKIASLLLALAMILSLAVTAYADETPAGDDATGETYTITINNTNNAHTYEAYQIFTGDLHIADGQKTLSNIKWGENASGKTVGDPVGDEILTNFNTEKAISLVDFKSTPAGTSSFKDGVYTISDLPAGYYLVKDKDNSLEGDDASYTSYILEIVEDSTVSPKSSAPKLEKKVEDPNDSKESMSEWQDSADYDIGDDVRFRLTATLASNVSTYKGAYKIVFHDTLSNGLTYKNGSIEVYVDGTKITSLYDDSCTDGHSLTITIPNVENVGAGDGSVITVIYKATLNENATIGSAGNPNTVYLEYSNNPNWNGPADEEPETGKTPEDKVIVFTYQVNVDKIHKTGTDEDGKPVYEELPGAGFTLFKLDGKTGAYVAVGKEITGEEMTTFAWKGLDDGDYKLEETTTPTGYNTIDPIFFTITAEHEVLSDNPQLTSLTGDVTSGEATFTADVTKGSLSTDVVNQAGVQLPETGGMGTTLFYVIGGVLVLAAVVLLVTKKRMGSAE